MILAIVPPLPVRAPLFGVIVVSLNLNVIALFAGKFMPVIATSVPAGPELGVSASIVPLAMTVKVALTV